MGAVEQAKGVIGRWKERRRKSRREALEAAERLAVAKRDTAKADKVLARWRKKLKALQRPRKPPV